MHHGIGGLPPIGNPTPSWNTPWDPLPGYPTPTPPLWDTLPLLVTSGGDHCSFQDLPYPTPPKKHLLMATDTETDTVSSERYASYWKAAWLHMLTLEGNKDTGVVLGDDEVFIVDLSASPSPNVFKLSYWSSQ